MQTEDQGSSTINRGAVHTKTTAKGVDECSKDMPLPCLTIPSHTWIPMQPLSHPHIRKNSGIYRARTRTSTCHHACHNVSSKLHLVDAYPTRIPRQSTGVATLIPPAKSAVSLIPTDDPPVPLVVPRNSMSYIYASSMYSPQSIMSWHSRNVLIDWMVGV